MPRKRVVKRRVVRRRRGRGFGDFIGSTLGGLGSGIGSGVHNLFGSLFGGRKRKSGVRRRRRGGAASDMEPSSALGKLNKILKETKLISKAADEFGLNPLGLTSVAKTLGYGKRKRRVKRKRGRGLINGLQTAVHRLGKPQTLLAAAALGKALQGGKRKRKRVVRRRRRGGLALSTIARNIPLSYVM